MRASHYFLTDGDIARLLPFVGQGLAEIPVLAVATDDGAEWCVFAALNRTLVVELLVSVAHD